MSRPSLLSNLHKRLLLLNRWLLSGNANMAALQPERSGSIPALPQPVRQHKRSTFPIVPPLETKPPAIEPKQSSVSEDVPG